MKKLFDAIINNDLEKVKTLVDLGSTYDWYTVEPETFEGKDGMIVTRKKPKNAIDVARFLKRQDIVDFFEKRQLACA